MTVLDDLDAGTRRAADDQPRSLQRRGAAGGPGRRDHPDRAPLRPQQLRGARRTTATLEVGGAVGNPITPDPRRPPRAAQGRARGHARVRRQRAAGDAAAADRRAVGRLRRVDRALGRRPPARGPARRRARRRTASTSGSRAPTTAPTTSARSSRRPAQDDLTFVRALPLAQVDRPGRGDPHRLRDERRAAGPRPRGAVPDRRAALVRRRVGEVAHADRRPDRAVRRRVPDRPLHLRVARPTARAGRPHARAGADHRARAPPRSSTPAPAPCAARHGRGPVR